MDTGSLDDPQGPAAPMDAWAGRVAALAEDLSGVERAGLTVVDDSGAVHGYACPSALLDAVQSSRAAEARTAAAEPDTASDEVTWVGVPLLDGDQLVAVLSARASTPGALPPVVDALTRLAHLAIGELRAARLEQVAVRARQQADTRRAQAQLLLRLSEALTDTTTVVDVAAAVAEVAAGALGVTWTYLGIVDDRARTLDLVSQAGRPGAGDARWGTLRLADQHPATHVVRTGRPLYFADAAAVTAQFPDTWDPDTGPIPYQATAHVP